MGSQCGWAEEDFPSPPYWNYQIGSGSKLTLNCCVHVGEVCMCGGQRKLGGVGSLPPFRGPQELIAGHLAHTANGFPTEPSHPTPQLTF